MELILRGGRVVDSSGITQADLWVSKGRIAGILAPGEGESIAKRGGQVRVESADGLFILPGVIDIHVHLREPGLEEKEDMSTGTKAAACSGITTVLDMPNSVPPVKNREILKYKMELAKGRIYVDVGFYGVVSDDNISSLVGLKEEGAIGYKLFLGPTTGGISAPSRGELFDAFQEVAKTGLPLVIHAEDPDIISRLEEKMRLKGDGFGEFLQSRPAYSEAAAIELAVRVAEATGVRLHIAHVSSQEAITVLQSAKARCELITGETCPQYLGLTEADWPTLGNRLKILPPVRTSQDQKALWNALRNGIIEVIASDHAPHLDSDRWGKNLWDSPAGVAGLETMLPLLLDWVNKGRLSLPDVVKLTAQQPAKTFGLWPEKGSLKPGAIADMVLVDMTQRMTIEGRYMHSKCKNTPFEGREVQGIPVATYLRGKLIASQGDLIDETPQGEVLQAKF